MASQKTIQRGAEALIVLSDNKIIKRRVRKSYRLPELDERIRRQRTKSEVKLLEKTSKVISVPRIIKADEKKKEIVMDFLKGKKLSENLDSFPLNKQKNISEIIGNNTAKIHDSDIIHGDLTTSNMICVENKKSNNDFKIYFIDFGLGFISQKVEDKAVDLHLLRQALESKHFKNWEILFKEVLQGYSISKNHKIVIKQFKKVEKRGRYKNSY